MGEESHLYGLKIMIGYISMIRWSFIPFQVQSKDQTHTSLFKMTLINTIIFIT
jgi:hypothetical protein